MSEFDKRDLFISSYDFSLDSKLIAQAPIEPRHASKLLVVEEPSVESFQCKHAHVWDLKDELSPEDLLVVNNTRVLKARLRVRRKGGGVSELLLLEPLGEGKWLCLGRPAKRLRVGDSLWLEADEPDAPVLRVLANDEPSGGRVIQFPSCYSTSEAIEDFLDRYGEIPLPPYIENVDKAFEERYQTRYAESPGAVAAPTAGLHLSDELMAEILKKGVQLASITLHVGLGTFRPIDVEDLTNLKLHREWVEVKEEVILAIKSCQARGGKVIAVGTTSVRALEGAYMASDGLLKPFTGSVDLVITPGYQFGVVDGLLTNFHLPKSSLLLLVSALIGRERLLALYEEAIEHQYRFFSFGDAMWIPPRATLPETRPKKLEAVE